MDNNNNDNSNSAVNVNVYGALCMLIISSVLIAVLSFMQKRTTLGLRTCNGVPGIVPPVNFLNPRHRLVYMLAFGVIGSQLGQQLFNSSSLTSNQWAGPIVQYLYVSIVVLVLIVYTYPLLACADSPIPLVGYFLGALYSILYLVFVIVVSAISIREISKSNTTAQGKNVEYSFFVVQVLPQLGCLLGIVVWYFYKLIKELVRISREGGGWNMQTLMEQPPSRKHFTYVKQLFMNNHDKVKRYVSVGLHLPLPVLIAAVVGGIIIFQLTVVICFSFPIIFNSFGQFFGVVNITHISKFFQTTSGVSVIAPISSSILSCVLFGHFIYTMRHNMKEIRLQQRELAVKPIKWPALTLGSCVRFAGYQAAAIVTAWIVHTIVIFVILMALMLLFFFPKLVGYLYYRLAITIGWLLLILGLQMLVCKLFFITKDSPELKTVVVNNRRMFNFFSYTIFLYNVMTGIMTAIVRVSLSFLFMMLILPRLDRIMYIRGFEVFDSGHGMYKNFMIMESLLHNSLVHVFVSIVSGNRSQLVTSNLYQKTNTAPSRNPRGKKAFNRWFVAYTLIKNPSLKEFRRSAQKNLINGDPLAPVNPLYSQNKEETY